MSSSQKSDSDIKSNASGNEIEQHEIEKLYSFKDFVKYRCDFIILNIVTIIIITIILLYLFNFTESN